MEIQGLDEFAKTLNNASKNFEKEASKKLDIIASKLIAKVKLKTPVDSGVLRRSWQPKKVSNLERLVLNNVKYGPHIEYGHRTRGGKSFVDGRYMLTKSVQEIEETLTSEFSMMIENLFNE